MDEVGFGKIKHCRLKIGLSFEVGGFTLTNFLNVNRLQRCKKSVTKLISTSGRNSSEGEGGVTGVTWKGCSFRRVT